MADISFAAGSSHGPSLSTVPEEWELRVVADRRNPNLWFRGQHRSYDDLAAERNGSGEMDRQSDPKVQRERYDACQRAIAELGDRCHADDGPDVLVVVTDDQHEVFSEELQPVFFVYHGSEAPHLPIDAEEMEKVSPGLGASVRGYTPEKEKSYECVPDLALHMVSSLVSEEFDISVSERLPAGRHGRSLGHGFGFIYQSVLREPIPLVPVLINTFYPPNQPSAGRCADFGAALARAVASWPNARKVGIVASGGLSHFVVDEDFDRRFLDALVAGDMDYIASIPDAELMSGTSEVRNWIAVAAAAAEAGLKAEILDYQPCYRSAAGTGSGNGFVTWA